MIKVDSEQSMSGLFMRLRGAIARLVLAHGAGAGLHHAFTATLATDLSAIGIAIPRFQFPYAEQGRKRLGPLAICPTPIRTAVAKAHQ